MRSSFRRPNFSGFTLLEIIVVMVLISLVGSLIYVNVGKSSARRKAKSFAEELVSSCRKARRMAIGRDETITFHISSSQRRCWINDSDKAFDVPEMILIEGEGVSLVDEDVFGIRFYPDGSSSGGTLTLSISGKTVYAFRIDRITGILTRIEEDA